MNTRLEFRKKTDSDEYTVWCGKEYLGDIAWRKDKKVEYLFFPDCIYTIGDMWFWGDCLREIAQKLDELNDALVKDGEE